MLTFRNFCVHCHEPRLPSEAAEPCPRCGKTQECKTSMHVYALFSKFGPPIQEKEEMRPDSSIIDQEVTPMRTPGPKPPDGS